MKDKLLIIGAGGHGKVVADIALKMNKWKCIAFLDDDENISSSMGIKVIGKTIDAIKYIPDYELFVAIGKNDTREKIQQQLESQGAMIPVLIHPSATIGEQVKLGSGTVVMARVVVNCCTTIGKGCILNTGCLIDHDIVLEDYVHISPGAHLAGNVRIGRRTWVGIGSTVINNIEIASDCIIGAGAVVIRDVTESGVFSGVPARKILKDNK